MEKTASVKKNFIMNIILTLSSIIFPLVTYPYVSRVLGPDGIGKITFVTSIVNYFNLVAQLGIPTYGVRACAQVRDDKRKISITFYEIFLINCVMTIVSYIMYFIVIFTVPQFEKEKKLYFVMGVMIVLTTVGTEWLYRGLEKYRYITIRSLIFKLISLAVLFLFVRHKEDYILYGVVTVIASSASYILNFINSRKYLVKVPLSYLRVRKHLKPIATFFAIVCASTIYTNLDNVMLGFMTNDTEVGYYGTAIKIKSVLISIVTSLGTVLLPRASYYYEQNLTKKFHEISAKAIRFVLMFSIPLTIYFILYAREVIFIIAGEQYKSSVLPMQILMPTLIVIGISNVLGVQILVPIGKEMVVLYSEIVGAFIDLAINWMLIPVYGASGAAIGTLLAEISVTIFQLIFIYKDYKDIFHGMNLHMILLATFCGLVLSCFIKGICQYFLLTGIVPLVVFFITYYIVLFISKDKMVRELTQDLLKCVGK